MRAHCLEHQAAKLDGYDMTPAEYFGKYDREQFAASIRRWNKAAWAVHHGLDLEAEARAEAEAMWNTPHYDRAKIPEYIERDVDGYRRQLAHVLAKREPCPVLIGDVLPINHPDVPELTVRSLKPFSGTDHHGRLWKIPRKLIDWTRFPRTAGQGPHALRPALPAPAMPAPIHTAALRLAAL